MSNRLQQTTSPYLLDRLLLARYFDVNLDISFEECLNRLQQLAQPKQGLSASSREITINGTGDDKVCNFTYIFSRYHLGGAFTTAKIVGTLWQNDEAGKTVIQGKVTLSSITLVEIVVISVLVTLIHPASIWTWVVFTITGAVIVLTMGWHDCQQLKTEFQNIFPLTETT